MALPASCSLTRAGRPGARRPRLAAALGACGALLLCLSPAAGLAAAPGQRSIQVAGHIDRDDDWGDAWRDYNRTILQMQRENISTQEEKEREAGRVLRRDELEKARVRDAVEREAYFGAILEASQASLRAPRGAYYRKPGHTSPDPPAENTPVVEAGGTRYLYDRGVFWVQQGSDYVVVAAPPGAVVGSLPPAAVRIPFGAEGFWYFFGAFYTERDGAYAVVKPPAGLTVHYLPDGYTREKLGEADVFRFGETLFKPVFVQGVLGYQVVTGR